MFPHHALRGVPTHGILANSASENRKRLLVPLSTTATRIVLRPVLRRGYGVGFRAGGAAGAAGATSEGRRRCTRGMEARKACRRVGGGGGGAAAGAGRPAWLFRGGRGGPLPGGGGGGGMGVESNMAVNSNRSGIGVVTALYSQGRGSETEEVREEAKGLT